VIRKETLFILTDNGYGKKTSVTEYNRIKRGGQGVKTITLTEKKGKIAGAKILQDDYDVMVISAKGIVIRVQSEAISRHGRTSQGVKIMNLEKSR
jgi:DNA gyrase subunit A